MRGIILYKGPSLLDGKPIVAILTYKSANAKTGPMAQTWILRQDVSPSEAVRSGEDVSICGLCPHRPLLSRETGAARCYVRVDRAPLSVWSAWRRGAYAGVESDLLPVHGLRIGAYGDPAVVPTDAWERAVYGSGAQVVTGYTHQWRTCDPYLSDLVMASVDSWSEWFEAKRMGWRTFRVTSPGQELTATEVSCPASAEAGQRKQCITCGICDGTRRVAAHAADVAIVQH